MSLNGFSTALGPIPVNKEDFANAPELLKQIEEADRRSIKERNELLKDVHEQLGFEKEEPIEWKNYQRNELRDKTHNNNGAIFTSLEDTKKAIEENNRTISDFKTELEKKYQELAQLKQDLTDAEQALESALEMSCDYTPCE